MHFLRLAQATKTKQTMHAIVKLKNNRIQQNVETPAAWTCIMDHQMVSSITAYKNGKFSTMRALASMTSQQNALFSVYRELNFFPEILVLWIVPAWISCHTLKGIFSADSLETSQIVGLSSISMSVQLVYGH